MLYRQWLQHTKRLNGAKKQVHIATVSWQIRLLWHKYLCIESKQGPTFSTEGLKTLWFLRGGGGVLKLTHWWSVDIISSNLFLPLWSRFLQRCPQYCSFMNFACFVDWCHVWVKERAEYFHINQQFFFTGKWLTLYNIKFRPSFENLYSTVFLWYLPLENIYISKGVSLMLPTPPWWGQGNKLFSTRLKRKRRRGIVRRERVLQP